MSVVHYSSKNKLFPDCLILKSSFYLVVIFCCCWTIFFSWTENTLVLLLFKTRSTQEETKQVKRPEDPCRRPSRLCVRSCFILQLETISISSRWYSNLHGSSPAQQKTFTTQTMIFNKVKILCWWTFFSSFFQNLSYFKTKFQENVPDFLVYYKQK